MSFFFWPSRGNYYPSIDISVVVRALAMYVLLERDKSLYVLCWSRF